MMLLFTLIHFSGSTVVNVIYVNIDRAVETSVQRGGRGVFERKDMTETRVRLKRIRYLCLLLD